MSDFALPDELASLTSVARAVADKELAPSARTAEREGSWSPHVIEVLRGLSLHAVDVPARLGGDGAGCVAKVVLLEALAAGDAGGLPAADQPGRSVGAFVACPDGNVAVEVIGPCLGGSAQAALLVVDPNDAPSRRVEWAPAWPPLQWAWITSGDVLSLVSVTALVRPISALAFQASGGVSVDLSSCSPVGTWTLPPGSGVDVRGRARLWAAAVAIGVAQAAFDATIAYTTERVVFGKPVAYHQGNAFDLAAAATGLHGARLAVRDAAGAYDRGGPFPGFHATQAWLSAIDAGITITDLGIQLLGGHGFLVDHLAEKRFREVRMLAQLAGGRDAAEADVAALVLDVPDPVFP